METLKIKIFVLFITFPTLFFAQNTSEIAEFETGRFVDKNTPFLPEIIKANNIEEHKTTITPSQGNEVFITQIGTENKIDSNVSSSDATVELRQNGVNNLIDIDLEAKVIRYRIVQNGNENIFTTFAIDPTAELNTNILQDGNNNTFESFGSNSIGDKLNFEIKGDSKTIIVRNFD